MLFPRSSIPDYLNKLGLQQNDTVMIQGDAGVAAQFIFDNSLDPVSDFIRHILEYFHDGTVIVPTYTYSATKGEIYDPKKTSSAIGQFSEKFRLMKGGIRSRHPIFSVTCFGKNALYFSESTLTDCFGEGTLFEKLYNNNVKILGLGCPSDRFLTFIHYVEQAAMINYRYFKEFAFCIQDDLILTNGYVKYFVRDLELKSKLDLAPFENIACEKKIMIRQSFGRFYSRLITAKDCYDLAFSLLRDDPYSLIQESTK